MATKKDVDRLQDYETTAGKPVSRAGEYPRYAQSAHYQVEVGEPATGIPVARISPVGWVGMPPLIVPESRIDELIELLRQVR